MSEFSFQPVVKKAHRFKEPIVTIDRNRRMALNMALVRQLNPKGKGFRVGLMVDPANKALVIMPSDGANTYAVSADGNSSAKLNLPAGRYKYAGDHNGYPIYKLTKE